MARMDVVIVGGGVIGLAIAREVARGGMDVALVERGPLGGGATRAAAGILSPTDAHEWEGPLGAFNQEAIAMWPAWAEELAQSTGLPSGRRALGELRLAESADDEFVAAAVAGAERFGLAIEHPTPDELRALVPFAALDGFVAVHLPDSGAAEPDELVAALREDCARARVELVEGDVIDVGRSGSLALRGGTELTGGRVVLATGAWTTRLGLGIEVTPVVGESILLGPTDIHSQTMVRSPAGSIVPRPDGSWWLGTTIRSAGFVERPELGALHHIAANAIRMIPGFAQAGVASVRSGLRPASPDGHPILGPVGGAVVMATGHGREGVIHAPLCAQQIAHGLLTDDWSGVTEAFRADRFAG